MSDIVGRANHNHPKYGEYHSKAEALRLEFLAKAKKYPADGEKISRECTKRLGELQHEYAFIFTEKR